MENFKNSLEKLDTLIQKLEVTTSTTKNPVEPCPKSDDKKSPVEEKIENEEKRVPKKKQKKQKKAKKPVDPKVELFNLYESADLRVGEIIECQPLEGSDKLYIEKISFGNNEVRTILSGLQKFVPLNEMKGKCIVFYNLKPRPLAGEMSNGMVICSQNKEHTEVGLLRPNSEIENGTRVNLFGEENELKEVGIINSKKMKKFLELLKTDEEGMARFSDYYLSTGDQKLIKTNQPNGTIG